MILVRNGQLLATFSTTRSQNATAISCGHSLTESVLVVTATVVGLKCSFHILFCLLFVCLYRFGVQNYDFFSDYARIGLNFSIFNFQFSIYFVTLAPPKVLSFGKVQINLAFLSLIRTFYVANQIIGCHFNIV